MAQSSMLELLALTDAAVKGLDKSVRSSSASSRSSRGSTRKMQQPDSPSRDSGVCRTNTLTDRTRNRGHVIHDSDESTTASDVLITSTTVDPDQHSFLLQNEKDLSNVSKCSKISIGSENFNNSGTQKVKISTKRLREIKSPFDGNVSPRADVNEDKIPAVLGKVSQNGGGKTIDVRSKENSSEIDINDRNLNRNAFQKVVPSKTHKIQSAPRGLSSSSGSSKSSPRGLGGDELTKSSPRGLESEKLIIRSAPRGLTETGGSQTDDHFFPVSQTHESENFEEFTPRDEGKELMKRKGRGTASESKTQVTPPKRRYGGGKQKTTEVFVERHTPSKRTLPGTKKLQEDVESHSDHGKDPLLDLSGSVDLLPQTDGISLVLDPSNHDSSQPEIVTIPERIVTVSAQGSVSTDTSLSDAGTQELAPDEERVPPMLAARFQLGSKMNSGILRQGAPVEGARGLDKQRESPEVKISSFKMSDKQKQIRQNFAKRYEQAGPVRRVVQPRIVGADKAEVKVEGSKVTGQTSETIAVAVAASVAVAATQPFLKAQQDLETKMAQILEKMAIIQNSSSGKHLELEAHNAVQESQRVMALEQQVSQLTDQRIEHLERLQEHQLQMQAKLISLTRASSQTKPVSSPQRTPPQQRKFPTPGADPLRRAFSKTTVNRTSTSPKGQKSSDAPVSPLDTPAPRSRAPRPVAYDAQTQQSKGILEEILASAGSPTHEGRGITIHQPIYTREMHHDARSSRSKSPNVEKAEKLVEELAELKDQMTELVSGVGQSAGHVKPEKLRTVEPFTNPGKTAEELLGPSPLDPYLVLPDVVPSSPYKSVPDISTWNAPVHSAFSFQDARQVLKQVGRNKAFLEANLDSVLRTRQEVEVYRMLENLYQESSETEQARLQQKVTECVANIREQVDREVTDEVILRELQKKHSKPLYPTKDGPVQPQGTKPAYRSTAWGTAGARVDSGLKRDAPKSAVGPSLGRVAGPSMGKAPRFADKENKTSTTAARKPVTKRAPPQRPLPVREEDLSRVYGKAVYNNKRTTQKDPYLHYQNQNITKPRSPGRPTQYQDVPGMEVKSARTQTKGGVKQFYFSPASGSFIPVASVTSAVPIPGQLIPMAVPLGEPRMEGGLTVPVTIPTTSGPVTSTPLSHPQVTASKNVALVSMPPAEEEEQVSPQPELGKQVLPAVDIDTDQSEGSVVRSKTGDVHLKSPTKSHYEVTFHEEQPQGNTSRDWRTQATLDDFSDGDLSPETAPGMALPGYSAPSPPPAPVLIAAFPPMVAGAEKLAQASDLIAADIRRKDLLENKATEWIEQEIMAHMISELYLLKPDKPRQMEHVVYEESEDSMADDNEQSMFMMDAIGRDGLQMFVDMGQPVDARLVDALIKEVLLEKVTTMLGQRPDDETTVQKEAPQGRTEAKLGASMGAHDTGRVHMGIAPEDEYDERRVRTPEPTPKATPITSPMRVLSPPVTPPHSPVVHRPTVQEPRMVPVESEPDEVSESVDISEEIRMLRDKLVPEEGETSQNVFDVVTPVPTPVPEPSPREEEERPLSPPLPSPRRPHAQPVLQIPVAPTVVDTPPAPKPEEYRLAPSRSPQPWGDPESPIPEENPDFREFVDDGLDKHLPYALSVAPIDESLQFPLGEDVIPSPPPKSPTRRHSPSPVPSDTETTSFLSTVSETYNQSVSEGQWLLSKSEGEVADIQLDDAALREMVMQVRHKGEMSAGSTLWEMDDLEDDVSDALPSEGEFQYKGRVAPESDAMLHLLARLQRHPPQYEQAPPSFLAVGQYDMTSQQVHDLLNRTNLSTGEVFLNGASVQKSQGEVMRDLQTQQSVGEIVEYEQPTRDTNTNRHVSRSTDVSSRNGSPLKMADLKSQSIQEESEPETTSRDDAPTEGPTPEEPGQGEGRSTTPSREGRSQASRGRQSTGMRGGMTPGGVSLGAGRISGGKSAVTKPPPATQSPGLPSKTISTTIPRSDVGKSDENGRTLEHKQSIEGGATMSDQGTRTFTPDQMNMEDLIKSGYLTQSRSGEFGQSGRLSQSYDQSSAMSQSTDNRNNVRDSSDSYVARQRNKGKSLGLTYSMDENLTATDSLNESELRQLATTGTLKMSVRMPALGDMEDDSERQSEFDMTDPM